MTHVEMGSDPFFMIPHSKPTLSNQEIQAVSEVLLCGQIASGPKVEAFERGFARNIAMPYAVAVSSGTAGLHLTLVALGIGPGDEVLIPSYVCAALFQAVGYVGATPVLVDSQPHHPHMDSELAARKISPRTKAVILPHLFGDVAAVAPWRALGLKIIEDGTQSLGNSAPEGSVGSLGDISIFSFYATKMITTGEGGIVACRDSDLANRLRDIRQYDEKDNFTPRYNYKMTDIAAALGLVQLEKLPGFIAGRRRIASQYDASLADSGMSRINQAGSAYYRYVVCASSSAQETIALWQESDIECKQPVYKPLHRLLAFQDREFPHTTRHFLQNVSIPIYPGLSQADLQTLCKVIEKTRHHVDAL